MCYGSWDCPCDGPEYECYKCDEKDKQIDNAKEFLESIVEMLYSKEALDLAEFEDHLDELCAYMDVKIGQGDLQIRRLEERKTSVPVLPILEAWKQYNNNYLQQLAN
jgi:hypothetical protein